MPSRFKSLAELLAGNPDAQIRFTCSGCHTSHDVRAASVLNRLAALGLGDDEADVNELGRFAERPCYRCGDARWGSRSRPPT
jgi:hypothetical protein